MGQFFAIWGLGQFGLKCFELLQVIKSGMGIVILVLFVERDEI